MGEAVILVTVEDRHHADVLHVPVLHDGIIDNLFMHVNVLQLMPRDVFQECRHGEDGAGTEPPAHVVARDMPQHGIVGYAEDVVLQLFQVAHAHDFLMRGGVTEDEVAEPHVLFHDFIQVAVARL